MSTVQEVGRIIDHALEEQHVPVRTQQEVYPFLIVLATLHATTGTQISVEQLNIMKANAAEHVPPFEGRDDVIASILRMLSQSDESL